MRRWIGVSVCTALLAVLCPRIASATFVPALNVPPIDLRTQVVLRFFGETSDPHAGFIASLGDSGSESPLRGFALRVNQPVTSSGFAVVDLPAASFMPANAPPAQSAVSLRISAPVTNAYAPPAPSIPTVTVNQNIATPSPLTAFYRGSVQSGSTDQQGVHFDLSVGSQSGNSPLVTFSPVLTPTQNFTAGSSGPDAVSLPQTQATVKVPVRVGKVRLETRFEGAQAEQPQLSLQDQAYGAGANFNVQAGKTKLNVDLDSRYEHLTINDPNFQSSSFDPTSTLTLSNDLPLLVPAYADVSKRTLSAGLAVPVTHSLTASVQYDTQHLLGGYGLPGISNLDARNDIYGGKLTFALPHTSSAISLTAKQYRYQDNILPSNTFTQTTAGVDFTVKF
jgi:hypothetical protein